MPFLHSVVAAAESEKSVGIAASKQSIAFLDRHEPIRLSNLFNQMDHLDIDEANRGEIGTTKADSKRGNSGGLRSLGRTGTHLSFPRVSQPLFYTKKLK